MLRPKSSRFMPVMVWPISVQMPYCTPPSPCTRMGTTAKAQPTWARKPNKFQTALREKRCLAPASEAAPVGMPCSLAGTRGMESRCGEPRIPLRRPAPATDILPQRFLMASRTQFLARALDRIPGGRLALALAAGRASPAAAPIFMLHRVLPDAGACYDPEMVVSVAGFERFLDWLQQHYRVMPLGEIAAGQRPLQGRPWCALTFDDGWV